MTDVSDAHTQVQTLNGRRVAITGGTTGIGRAIAVLLAAEGAVVHICGRDADHLKDAVARIESVGTGGGTAVDLTEDGAVERFFDAAGDAMGGIDAVVINAAVAAEGLTDMTMPELCRAIAINFKTYLTSAHVAADRLGGRGDIAMIGSLAAQVLGPGSTVYAGIKAGIAGFSKALRRELGPKGIRVSLVEPGKTESDMQADLSDAEQVGMIRDETMLRAEDIAVGVHYLLTQPRRTVIQQLTIVPRAQEGE